MPCTSELVLYALTSGSMSCTMMIARWYRAAVSALRCCSVRSRLTHHATPKKRALRALSRRKKSTRCSTRGLLWTSLHVARRVWKIAMASVAVRPPCMSASYDSADAVTSEWQYCRKAMALGHGGGAVAFFVGDTVVVGSVSVHDYVFVFFVFLFFY